MIKIMFVCLGNICRSPMAEFVLKNMLEEKGISENFYVCSSATSNEEIGNPVYPPARRKLMEHNITCEGKTAVQLKKSDYEKYDYFICMDDSNLRNILNIFGGDKNKKVSKLLQWAASEKNVADPWYTGDFSTTYEDIVTGCEAIVEKLTKEKL